MSALRLMVCPHDTVRNSEGWYRLVQYLTKQTAIEIHFDLALDFAEFSERYASADLVYANPSDAMRLIKAGYVVIAAPAGVYDEAMLVADANMATPSLAAIHGAPLATVPALLPTKLALRMLAQQGITPGSLVGCDSWLSVVRTLWNGAASYGVLYRDAYDELSAQGKAMIHPLVATDEKVAFHMLCVASGIGATADRLRADLLAMADNPSGQEVLHEMRISAWRAVTDVEITALAGMLSQ